MQRIFSFNLLALFKFSFFFVVIYITPLKAQNEMFHAYTIEDGLPENTANVLMQDTQGQVWIGTQAGAVIFDGARFNTIRTDGKEGFRLSNNMVESLYEDQKGQVYIGTRNGMNVYNPVTGKVAMLMPDAMASYGNNFCRPGFYEDDNFVWFISKSALLKIHKTSLHLIEITRFESATLGVMQPYKDGLLISKEGTLLWYDIQKNKYQKWLSLPNYITSISTIEDTLWIGTLQGIYNKYGKAVITELQSQAILYMNKSSDGRLWIGTPNGIATYTGDTTRYLKASPDNRLQGNLQLSFLEDSQQNLWFGTNAALNRLIPFSEKIEKNIQKNLFQLPSSQVNSISYASSSNMLAIGTENGVNLSFLDPKVPYISILKQNNLLSKIPINFVQNDVLGRIWVGTKSGEVYGFDKEANKIHLKGVINGIRGFYYDPKTEVLYIAGSEGLFAAGIDRVIYRPKWAKDIKYTVSILDTKNGFWITHSDCIYEVDITTQKVHNISKNQTEIPSYMITNQLVTDSLIWFSSISGGVFSYNPTSNQWAKYHILKGKNVWSTFQDYQGRFWSNTDEGLYIHNGTDIIQKLDTKDGLNYNDFNMSTQSQLKNGILIYGNSKGINIINPLEIVNSSWNASPYISGLEINFKSRQAPKLRNLLLLLPNEKSITLRIGLDDFQHSSDAEISYQLENFQDTWSSFIPIQYPINFTGLPSGAYVLKVRVRDKSGRLSKTVLEQPIKILPHFYETWLFKLLLIVILVIIIGFFASFKSRQKQKIAENSLKTERAIHSERERISRDLHDSIGAGLTKIISDLDIMELQTELKNKPVSVKELSKTRNYVQDTINNLRETIWTLDSKVVKLQDLFHQTQRYVERYLPEDITFEITMDNGLSSQTLNPEVAVTIFRIIQELTQNMLKYSKASQFTINFSKNNNIKLIVVDNGIGFDFDEVSQGEGLKNILKRLNQIQGNMTYINKDGSIFTIYFN
ncbi:ligand-binding sensor domain-containing protein [Polaribacter sp.]|uniref:ligand-binding sensor domain-containing protein n=1 Tax=Polaribacter sp. TaxID=1920175 RepID=UPI004047E5F1